MFKPMVIFNILRVLSLARDIYQDDDSWEQQLQGEFINIPINCKLMECLKIAIKFREWPLTWNKLVAHLYHSDWMF